MLHQHNLGPQYITHQMLQWKSFAPGRQAISVPKQPSIDRDRKMRIVSI